MYNKCFHEGLLTTNIDIVNNLNGPVDNWWDTHFMSQSLSSASYCGLTLATGSNSTNTDWYTLNGPIITSSVLLGKPSIIYRSASAESPTASVGIRRQFTVTESCTDTFSISHMGLTGRISDT